VFMLTEDGLVDRFKSTQQIVQAAGETSRIQQGLFENYLESKVKDPYLSLVSYFYYHILINVSSHHPLVVEVYSCFVINTLVVMLSFLAHSR